MRVALYLPLFAFLSIVYIAYSKDEINALNLYEELNKKRGNYAKQNNISNMNRVVFDTCLIGKIKSTLPELCTKMETNFEGMYQIYRFRKDISKKLFQAGITRVAFAQYNCPQEVEPQFFMIYDVPQIKDIAGPPGSQCSEGRSADSKRSLCSFPNVEDNIKLLINDKEAERKFNEGTNLSPTKRPPPVSKPSSPNTSKSSSKIFNSLVFSYLLFSILMLI